MLANIDVLLRSVEPTEDINALNKVKLRCEGIYDSYLKMLISNWAYKSNQSQRNIQNNKQQRVWADCLELIKLCLKFVDNTFEQSQWTSFKYQNQENQHTLCGSPKVWSQNHILAQTV